MAREGSAIFLKNLYSVYFASSEWQPVIGAGVFATTIFPQFPGQLRHSSWCNWKLRGLVCATNFGEQSSWFYHGGFMPNDGRLPSCNYKLHTHTLTAGSVCKLCMLLCCSFVCFIFSHLSVCFFYNLLSSITARKSWASHEWDCTVEKGMRYESKKYI